MEFTETALAFECKDDSLTGIVSLPESPLVTGVLIIVGGPQYRIGSHRQFTLLARDLACAGIPSMRFDYRGMGDSEGDLHTFENVREDIRAAVDAFFAQCPGLEKVVLWGLCDAASAAVFYAHQDPRVCGLVLVNPWIRTAESRARTQLKHYYFSRMTDPALWRKLLAGAFDFRASFRDFFKTASALGAPEQNASLPDRMKHGLEQFSGKILLILSGNDLTAREFDDMTQSSASWRELLKKAERRDLPEADHTFSCRLWRDRVSAWTVQWV
ncbi:MAG: hydrolase 1, exosortase A system-associated [Burkholderiales bacterium]|nr:hydrolase 1, exosortase A system-associated [Burkholderiales bacterium]